MSHEPYTPVPRSNPKPPTSPPAIRVLPAALAARLFPEWGAAGSSTLPPSARLRLLARAAQSQAPGSSELILVCMPDGSLLGIVPVGGELYGFATAGSGRPASPAALLSLATRLAAAATPERLADAVAEYAPGGGRVPPVVLLPGSPDVVTTRAAEAGSIIGRLLDTYSEDGCRHIQTAGRFRPPQPAEVARVVDGFLPLAFPGYHGPPPANPGFEPFVCRRASALQHRLARLVRRALAFHAAALGETTARPAGRREAAQRVVAAFFDGLPQLRRTLDHDARAAYKRDPALGDGDHHLVPLAYPGLYATFVHRVAHLLHTLDVPYIPRMVAEYAHGKTGIDIHPGARIGRGFFVDHGTGVVVGETAEIGDDVTLYQGVTLGALNFPKDECGDLIRGAKRHPTVRGNTVIYAGASVLGGNVEVGHGSRVGANASLRETVPPESRVRIPEPLRCLSIDGPAGQGDLLDEPDVPPLDEGEGGPL